MSLFDSLANATDHDKQVVEAAMVAQAERNSAYVQQREAAMEAATPLSAERIEALEHQARTHLEQSARAWMANHDRLSTGYQPERPTREPEYHGAALPPHLQETVLRLEQQDRQDLARLAADRSLPTRDQARAIYALEALDARWQAVQRWLWRLSSDCPVP